jgi:flagellar basal-body rod modification protein FlgD
MSVPAVTATSQAAGTPTATQLAALNAATGAQGGQTTLGENDFLQLLTTQLQNQDPMDPMSNTDFIAQMATFSQLQTMNSLNTNFQGFSQSQDISTAQNYIGKNVSVSGAAEGVAATTGTVTAVSVTNGAPDLTINGTNYSVSDVTGVSLPAAATTPTASTTPTN